MARILVDLDGTIAALHEPWVKWHQETCGCGPVNVEVEDWKHATACGPKLFEFLRGDDIYKDVTPERGAVVSLHMLARDGHELLIVSEASPVYLGEHYKMKKTWLWQQGLSHLPLIVVPSGMKPWLAGDVLVEDRISVVREWQAVHWKAGLLHAQPWNVSAPLFCGSWADIVAYIRRNYA